MTSIALATNECKPVMTPNEATECMITSTWSYANCTSETAQVYNSTGMWIKNYTFSDFGNSTLCTAQWNISTIGSYNYLVTNKDSGEIIVEAITMGTSIAISIFILAVTGIIFLLPFIMNLVNKKFSDNIILNLIINRGCYVLGAYLMVLNSAIMATLASAAGLNLTNEMFFYMNFFGWAGYLFMIYLCLKTLIDSFKIAKNLALRKRMGEDMHEN